MASQILASLVPGFADAAGVYVLEQLLNDGAPVPPQAGAGRQAVVARRLAARTAGTDQYAFGAAFPSGEVVAFAADSFSARCLRGTPVLFTQPGGGMLRRMPAGMRSTLGGYSSFLAAPMTTRSTVIGILILARGPGAPPFSTDDVQAAADLAGRAGAAVADSLALMRHQSVTEALLPRRAVTRLPQSRLEIAGRCLPATGCEAGGDWYDIVPLPGGRTGLIVGDVMGHGPVAATVMTRLSAAAYTLADLDLPPAEVMRQLNRLALARAADTLATCAYAVIDPVTQSCEIATAGHLPPVLARPGATTRVIDLPGGQSLGVSPADYGQARIKLRPGTILALYTDGLVETRTRPFDQGILALCAALEHPHPDLDATCDQLAAAETREDDITLVLVRIQPDPAG